MKKNGEPGTCKFCAHPRQCHYLGIGGKRKECQGRDGKGCHMQCGSFSYYRPSKSGGYHDNRRR